MNMLVLSTVFSITSCIQLYNVISTSCFHGRQNSNLLNKRSVACFQSNIVPSYNRLIAKCINEHDVLSKKAEEWPDLEIVSINESIDFGSSLNSCPNRDQLVDDVEDAALQLQKNEMILFKERSMVMQKVIIGLRDMSYIYAILTLLLTVVPFGTLVVLNPKFIALAFLSMIRLPGKPNSTSEETLELWKIIGYIIWSISGGYPMGCLGLQWSLYIEGTGEQPKFLWGQDLIDALVVFEDNESADNSMDDPADDSIEHFVKPHPKE